MSGRVSCPNYDMGGRYTHYITLHIRVHVSRAPLYTVILDIGYEKNVGKKEVSGREDERLTV